jgi:DNA-directed RNA polymerase subunit RPC12/RpoP
MAETEAAAPADRHQFPCAQCGAQLRFTPGQRRLTCQYCGHEQEIPSSDEDRNTALTAHDLREALANHLPPEAMEETRVINCTNCGAQVEFDPDTHALQCPFCASPVVTDTGMHRHIKPAAVLPFRLTEKEAHESMNRWLKSLWFAPNGLKRYARSDRQLDGLYVPYWAFDAFTRSRYSGERGDAYYETRSVTRNGKRTTEQVRKIRWRRVSGSVQRQFHDVLVMAAQSLPRKFVRALEPWMLADLSPYDPQFLAGFRAEGYTVDLPDGYKIGIERMEEIIRQDVRRDIGGDEQRIHSLSTDHSEEKFKHLLLPIWMAAYRYHNKSYRFIVNAQTGKVQGERPWSKWKIAGAVLLGLVLAGLFLYFGEFQ